MSSYVSQNMLKTNSVMVKLTFLSHVPYV